MELTITLTEWEEELVNFIKEGYNTTQIDPNGDEANVSQEDVIHGLIEFFVIAKSQIVEEQEEGLLTDLPLGSEYPH